MDGANRTRRPTDTRLVGCREKLYHFQTGAKLYGDEPELSLLLRPLVAAGQPFSGQHGEQTQLAFSLQTNAAYAPNATGCRRRLSSPARPLERPFIDPLAQIDHWPPLGVAKGKKTKPEK